MFFCFIVVIFKKISCYFSVFAATHSPPKSCIPRSAKMRMNKNNRNRSEIIERIEFKRETTRLRRDAQCLRVDMSVEGREGEVVSNPLILDVSG